MRKQITENRDFNIISRSIDNATKCSVINTQDDYFIVKLATNVKYEAGESVEMFSVTQRGQLYFETFVKEVNNNELSIWYPITYKYLQRREFSRIKSEKGINLTLADKIIPAKIIDLSAGGLKIETDEQLQLLNSYDITINIENTEIKTKFEPIRIEIGTNGFISSGKFLKLNNHDRISLVQYCFIKQIEAHNK